MALASEYVDDGKSFVAIDPLSINPDSLTDFSLFERHPGTSGMYRFRCLLMDTRSIEKERLMSLLRHWEQVYIHKKEAEKYAVYVEKNLEFILTHEDIHVSHKTQALTRLASDVVADAFSANFSSGKDVEKVVAHVETLIGRVVDFIADISSLNGIASLVGHDYQTHTHSIKVGWLMAAFINSNRDLFPDLEGEQLKPFLVEAVAAGFFHDLGKVKIPKDLISKPGRLNNLELIVMQSHSAYAASMLFGSTLSRTALQSILYHHENEDGSGYPCGLAGEDIPLMAKICHIADVFDALTSERPYKKAKTAYEALIIMAGENPYLDALKKFEAEAARNVSPPVTTLVRDNYEAKLKRLREREMLEAEAEKRVKARMQLRDKGMAHCFDLGLLRRFILTLNRSESFDFSGLI